MKIIFLLGFIFWGWAEMSAFIYIGNKFGGLLTLLGVFGTAICGLSMIKNQGRGIIAQIQTDLTKSPATIASIANTITMVCGGILMIIPGYLTDVIGLLAFVPGVSGVSGTWVLHRLFKYKSLKKGALDKGSEPFTFSKQKPYIGDFDIIEGDFTEHSPKKKQSESDNH